MVKDMTEGKPGRLILEFAIPLYWEIYSSSFTVWWILRSLESFWAWISWRR